MNFDLTTTDWTQVTDLTDDTTYFLQAKTVVDTIPCNFYEETPILFAQSATTPADAKTGIYTGAVKFKKVSGVNIYVKEVNKNKTNIEIQEVQ